MIHANSREARIFVASFLVLFLEIALIRWMPAYIRLLAYFSNFILLASFLGIGIGCLLAARRVRLFVWFPLLQGLLVAAVYIFRLEVGMTAPGSIFFTSGSDEPVILVEGPILLPLLFVGVAALFAALAQRMGREMATVPPLRGYMVNLAGSLAGIAAFGVMSWLMLSPTWWFGLACAAALPLLGTADPQAARTRGQTLAFGINAAVLAVTLLLVHSMARGHFWSPYYKITVGQRGADTVVEVNNIFHQSIAPLKEKEYFYEWPYTVFGETFEDVLVLGAGSGTDVAAALAHGARRVDAVEIDPVIIELGRRYHPDRPYWDPRVTVVLDDARHFLRTSAKKYDLIVFALIDSLTLQSGFSGVRLESYMFTEQSFRAVRDHLTPDGLLVAYNYYRQPWLVDRLANTAAAAFGQEPWVHVHEAKAYLGVLMAGPRLAGLANGPEIPDRVSAFGQSRRATPARMHQRDPSIEPASDDWPFLYLRDRHIPRHYRWTLALILGVSVLAVGWTLRGQAGVWSWEFFLLGAGFMLLETRAIIQLALLWGSTWIVASLAIAAVLSMAMIATYVVSRVEIRRPWLIGGVLLVLLVINYAVPVGRVGFDSLALESAFYAALMFSPILCAGLLFGAAIKRSASLPRDYGTNLLGAMAGGAAEYLSLVTGYGWLLLIVGLCYVGALATRRMERPALVVQPAVPEAH